MTVDMPTTSGPTDRQIPNAPTPGLESELARLRLQVEVAAAIAPDLEEPLPSPADRQIVVADIVTCRQHLSDNIRHGYDIAELRRGITGFAKDYFELIHEYLEPDPDYQPPALKSSMTEASVPHEHRVSRPAWTCDPDGHEWPCPAARKLLADAFPDETPSSGT